MTDDREPATLTTPPPLATADDTPREQVRSLPARGRRTPPLLGGGRGALVARVAGPVAVAALLLLVALWPRAAFVLDVGAPGDRLFLSGVHGDERVAEYSYRWTGKDDVTRLTVPGWGAVTRARLAVRAQALPDQAPVTLTVLADGRVVGTLPVTGAMAWQTVELALPSDGADPTLALRSPLTTAPGDPRRLGVKLDALRLEPLSYDPGAYLRTVWGELVAPLAALALLLAAGADRVGRRWWLARLLLVGAFPGAALVALPWTLALAPYVAAGALGVLLLRFARRLGDALALAFVALDRPRVANWVAGVSIIAYTVVLLAIVVQVPWVGHADYADNAVVAANLVRGRGFSVDYLAQFYRDYPTPRHPADTWPPLQPLLIAPFFLLFGVSTVAAKLPNVVVMAALLLLVYRVGAARWSPRVGLLAALFLAVHNYLFNGVLYPLNDLVFTLLALACVVVLSRLVEALTAGTAGHDRTPRWWRWVVLGLLGGLLYLAKPSGLVLLAGAALWALWRAWRAGVARRLIAGGALAAGSALVVVLPWLVRNLTTFGVPFYSTEQYDAWVLKYQPDEAIYRVYAGRLPLPHPRLLVGYGFDLVTQAIAKQFRLFWTDLSGGQLAPVALLVLAALGGCLLACRQRRLLAPLLAATLPYAVFVMVYWHYERRYALFLLPWLTLLAAGALWWLYERLARARGARLASVALLVTLLVLLAPQVGALRDDALAAERRPSSVVIADWVAANTPPDAVIMTRNPWELSFHSGREAVMIPYDSLDAILAVAQRYQVTYLQLDHLDRKDLRRPALAPLYDGREAFGFRKVYATPTWIVYQFPPAGR